MDLSQGTIFGFLLGGIIFGVIAWQLTARRSKAEREEELRRSKAEREQDLADDAQRIWLFLQHELQQPVGTVRLALDRLERIVTNATGKDTIKTLRGQINLFSDLTEACRTYAEFLESGTAQPQIVSVDEVLQEVKQGLLDYDSECEIDLNINDLTGPLKVNANRDQLRVIYRNILDNAWKYSSKNKPVRVDADSAQGQVVVDVRNDGMGLDNGTMDKIREVGGRGGDPNIPGRGLGLYYTDRIVQANGGKLIHEKQPSGQLMRVILPAAQDTDSHPSDPVSKPS